MTESDDLDELPLDDEFDEADEPDELTDEELADALEWLHGPRNPLAGYATPVTRPCKPVAVGRTVVDLPPL